MFFGEFAHSLDDKGRIVLPIKFRYLLGEKFVICKGLHRCLFVIPTAEWSKFDQCLSEQAFTNLDAIRLQRWFSGSAFEVTTDNQNRLAIPAVLREHAGIEGQAVVVGAASHVEIWHPDRWAAINADVSPEDLAASAQGVGFGEARHAQTI